VLRTSLLVGVVGGLILGLCSQLVLSVFGPSYVHLATWPLLILIVAYIPELPNTVYIAVCRATGRVKQAAFFLTAAAAVQMAAVVVGGKLDGLYGLSIGILVVASLQALVTVPPVMRAAYGRARIDSATAEVTRKVTGGSPRVHLQSADDAMQLRQEAGLAALLSMATTVNPDRHRSPGVTADRRSTVKTTAWMQQTDPQVTARRGDGRHQRSSARATKANPALTDTSWWPDINEPT
jgi:hypothetical protein